MQTIEKKDRCDQKGKTHDWDFETTIKHINTQTPGKDGEFVTCKICKWVAYSRILETLKDGSILRKVSADWSF